MFLDLKPVEERAFAFGDMGKGKITDVSKIGITFLASIKNVLYVEGLKYNFFITSQFCDGG